MVKIPERPWAGLTVGRIEPPSLNSSSFFASLGSASEKIVSAARIIRSQREHDRLTEAQNAYEEAVGQWTGQLRDNRQGGSASGCTREFLERHSDIVGETTRRMRENGAQKETSEAFANWSESRAKETLGRIAGFEHEQMQRHGLAVHEQRVTNLGAKLERDPESYADTLGQLEECFTLAVGQGLFSPQQARERFAGVRPLLQEAAFNAMYDRDRDAALRDMEPLLGFDETQKAQALRRYEADNARDLARSRSAEQARLGLLDLDIALAENDAATSGDGGSLRRLAGEFDSLGRMESATELQNLADFYERNAASIRESRTMPFSELERKVEELRKAARPSPVAGETENPGETALHEETRLREKILMERRQALLTDPAAAVAEEVNAAGSSLFDPGVQNRGIEGEAMPLWKLAELRLALQAASSVPPGRRRVLTNEESTAYRSLWQQADAEARMRLAGTILSYGKQSDKVAVESGLSPSERLALMRSRSDPAAASALARIFSVRVSASIPESGAYSREENVRTAAVEHSEVVRGLRAATSLFPDHAGLKSLLEDCEYTLEGLSRMRAGPPSATASLLDGTLKSLTHGRFALFYDSSLWPDPEELKSRLTRVVMDKLRAGIEPEDDAASPGQSGQFDQFVGRLELLQSSGVWLNGPDGQGYALFDPLTGQTVLDFENNPLLLDDVQLLSGQV